MFKKYAALIITIAIIVFFASTHGIDFSNERDRHIFYVLRLPRVLLAFFAGGALAIAGQAFQALFANSLASPYTLGVASGASLGAAIAIWLGASTILGTGFMAFWGAIAVVSVVWMIGFKGRGLSPTGILLVGVAINLFCAGAITFIQVFLSPSGIQKIMHWMMGGVAVVGFESLVAIIPLSLIGLVFLFFRAGAMNVMGLGDDFALAHGVNAKRERLVVFVVISAVIAVVVAQTGPIGYIGLVVPHIGRSLMGTSFRKSLLAVFMTGAGLLVLADFIARVLSPSADFPVGVVTSILGAPLFLGLVLRNGEGLRAP
jgi:iron complex transport system permease protein